MNYLKTKEDKFITTAVGAKSYCRAKGLDFEKEIAKDEQTGKYYLIEKEQAKSISPAKKTKITIDELLKRAEDEGIEVLHTVEDVEEAIEEGIKQHEAQEKEKKVLDEQGFDPFDAQQTMDFIKRIESQPKVLMTITPKINRLKNIIEDKLRPLKNEKGIPQVDSNQRPIMVAYVEATINGINYSYNITDPYRRTKPFTAPLDVAKVLADAYYPDQCAGFQLPDGGFYTPHQVGSNALPLYAAESEFTQTFTPSAGQKVFVNR